MGLSRVYYCQHHSDTLLTWRCVIYHFLSIILPKEWMTWCFGLGFFLAATQKFYWVDVLGYHWLASPLCVTPSAASLVCDLGALADLILIDIGLDLILIHRQTKARS